MLFFNFQNQLLMYNKGLEQALIYWFLKMELTVFHGSPEREDRPAFGMRGNTSISTKKSAFFTTNNRDYAHYFARGGTLTEFKLRSNRILSLFDPDTLSSLLKIYISDKEKGCWDYMLWGEPEDSPYEILESEKVIDFLKQNKIDAIEVPEDSQLGVTSFAIINPECLELINTANLNTPKNKKNNNNNNNLTP